MFCYGDGTFCFCSGAQCLKHLITLFYEEHSDPVKWHTLEVQKAFAQACVDAQEMGEGTGVLCFGLIAPHSTCKRH